MDEVADRPRGILPRALPTNAADTAGLVRAATDLAASRVHHVTDPWDEVHLAKFVRLYRNWVIQTLGMDDAPEEWAERNTILLHLMIGGATIGEAIEMLVRFSQAVWGPRTRFEYVVEGETAKLIFHEAERPAESGLICALWSIRATLSQIEFLAGGELDGVAGSVRNDQCLPTNITNLFFGKPISFGATETALLIPRSELHRAVAVRTVDIPGFLNGFMRTMVGANRSHNDVRSLISTLISDDRLRGSPELATMPAVAKRLGMSVATARRRLHDEGITFREVKDEAFDQLAKMWLGQRARTIESIAEQLDYSDCHAFRRAFRRRNGVSPRSYRTLSAHER